ncbi:MAG: phosphatase PAP2 family protein [Termitinemataceae bacterium]|nr:MAG: phosphatase PAP2 family protein [Termitinemataceae bacterium]
MKKTAISIFCVLVTLLALGTFFDLYIAQIVYNPQSKFGKIFGTVGMLPQIAVTLMIFPMVLSVIAVHYKTMKLIAAPIIAVIVGGFVFYNMRYVVFAIQDHVNISVYFAYIIIAIVLILIFFITLPFAKKYPNELLSTAIIGFLTVAVGSFILQTLKIEFGRQRFFTMTDAAVQFSAWYNPQNKAVSDDFKSFPSGHSFSAMLAVWFTLFGRFIPALKNLTKFIGMSALLFGFATMASRMFLGKHFLSDVTIGAFISLFCFFVFYYAIDKNYNKMKTLIFKQ